VSEAPPRRRLRRSRDRKLGGVAAGVAEYFDLEPTVVRLVFVLAALLGVGLAIPVYIVLWIVMPSASAGEGGTAGDAERGETGPGGVPGGRAREVTILGAVLLGAGLLLLAGQLDIGIGAWRVLRFSWPIALIAIGIAFLLAGPRRR
jgi:phage shock protein PspC (stress-responsive transcriptional regulator)